MKQNDKKHIQHIFRTLGDNFALLTSDDSLLTCTSRLEVCIFMTGENSCACMLTAGHWPSSIPVQSPLPPIPPPKSLEKKRKKKYTAHELCNPVSQGQGWSCELDGCLISTCCSAHTDQRVEAGGRHLSLHVSEFTAHNRFQQEG